MSLPEDLLAQAWHLAQLDKKKPRQANLRRAISVAYYALFHLLVGAGGYELAPPQPPTLKLRVQRVFDHASMKAVCKKFVENNLNHLPLDLGDLVHTPVEKELVDVATTFIEMQELRHQADYNVAASFDRTQVLVHIASVEDAFRKWKKVVGKPNISVFLTAMMFQKR